MIFDFLFKVVYDETPTRKMIAFGVPNEGSNQPLSSFVANVCEVERLTGLRFFESLLDGGALKNQC